MNTVVFNISIKILQYNIIIIIIIIIIIMCLFAVQHDNILLLNLLATSFCH